MAFDGLALVWLVMPPQVEAQVLRWVEEYAEVVEVATHRQFDGHTVYAVTVTDRSVPDDDKVALICDVPHAHEPGGTAACMNVLSQLITGAELDGTPTTHDVAEIRRRAIVTIIPDANPGGRARAPVAAWDGEDYSNDEFLKYAFGIDGGTGERFRRARRWRMDEENVARLGMVWDQIDEQTFVEPNRDPESSLWRLTSRLREQRRYDRWISLHQTEFENSDRNCMILLPILQEELPPEIQDTNRAWAEAIVAAWAEMGERPVSPPKPLGYGGEQRRYLVELWGDVCRGMPKVTTEVQNNNRATPPEMQLRLQEVAIWTTIEEMLRNRE